MSGQELITEHLDLWTEAVTKKSTSGRGSNGKIELTGIKKLRELILELAVRGSLVDQEPSDESAQELLERCLKAKIAYVELGKLKKARKHATITSDETPFGLPQSWVWSRLDDLVRVINGRAYKRHEMLSSGTPLLRVGNLFTSNDWYYSDLVLEDDKYIDSGDLIYAWSASFGPFIWDGGRAIYHYHIWKLDLFDELAVDKRFLHLYLKAITEEIKSSGSGIAMIHMTKAKMEELIVPVPPLEEQHRIVQKVDELMALCNQLEQQTSDHLAAHETLVDTLLGTLTQSENATELADNWARLATHFDTLFTTEQSIDKLKQTILQLAVMGRLVEQGAGDEPAQLLLDRISALKQELYKKGKLKKPKNTPSIQSDEPPYEIPKSWAWTRMSSALLKITDGTHHSPPNNDTGDFMYVSAKNIKQDGVQISGITYVSQKVHEEIFNRCNPEKGDILYIKDGATTGIATINQLEDPFSMLSSVALLKPPHEFITNRYLLYCLRSPFFYDEIRAGMTGVAITRVTLKNLDLALIPIPPIQEQHRIVQKVDELMALCDRLKERLNQASETRCQLANAIVEQGLSA